MVEHFPIGDLARGVTEGFVRGAVDSISQLFRRTPEPNPFGPFMVRNLSASQRFYQEQDLSFEEGEFVARSIDGQDLLDTICSLFEKQTSVGVWGEGGSGKTRLAAEVVATILQDLPGGVLWLSAAGSDRFTLKSVLADLSHMLGTPGRRNIRRAVKEQLESMGRVLLVLDNLENVSDPELFTFIADLPGNCSLLFTTKIWRDIEYKSFRTIEIPILNPEESEALAVQQAHGRTLTPEHLKEILQECMGNAWLIRVLVSAAIEGGLRKILDDLRKGNDPSSEGRAFQATYAQLSTEAQEGLVALSLFQPTASVSDLTDIVPQGLESALSELRRSGLAKFDDAVDDQNWWVTPGVPSTFARTLPDRTRFEPVFAMSMLHLAERLKTATMNAENASPSGQFWEQRQNFMSALSWYGRAVSSQPTDGKIFDSLFKMLRLVSSSLEADGFWQEIVDCQIQALEAAQVRSDDSRIGEMTHRLGMAYQSRALYAKAQQYYEQSIKSNSRYPLGVARSRHQIGIVAQHLGQYDRAEALLKQSHDMKQALLDAAPHNGRLRFEIAYSLHGLAVLKLDMGDYPAAEALARESLSIKREQGVPSNLNQISLTRHVLGQILRWDGRYGEAEKEFRVNLEDAEKARNRGATARTQTELGWLALHVHNKPDEALRLYEESLQTSRELPMERHEARVLSHIGELLHTQGRFAEAEGEYVRSIEILRELEDVRDLAMVLDSFVDLLDEVGRHSDAIAIQREASDFFRMMNRPEAPGAQAKLERLETKS